MSKKGLCLALTLVLAIMLVACGSGGSSSKAVAVTDYGFQMTPDEFMNAYNKNISNDQMKIDKFSDEDGKKVASLPNKTTITLDVLEIDGSIKEVELATKFSGSATSDQESNFKDASVALTKIFFPNSSNNDANALTNSLDFSSPDNNEYTLENDTAYLFISGYDSKVIDSSVYCDILRQPTTQATDYDISVDDFFQAYNNGTAQKLKAEKIQDTNNGKEATLSSSATLRAIEGVDPNKVSMVIYKETNAKSTSVDDLGAAQDILAALEPSASKLEILAALKDVFGSITTGVSTSSSTVQFKDTQIDYTSTSKNGKLEIRYEFKKNVE